MMSCKLGRSRALLSRLPDGPVMGSEVGVLDGRMSCELLLRSDLSLIMVDRWENITLGHPPAMDEPLSRLTPGEWLSVRERAFRDTAFAASRRFILVGDSANSANLIARRSLDFVFLDADHSYHSVKRDIAAWLPCLKSGGLLCGHDYHSQYPWTCGVTQAVDEFAQHNNFAVEAGEDCMWFVRTPTQGPE